MIFNGFEINVGSRVKIMDGILPSSLNGQWIEITKVDDYPYFFDGYQESAISPEIILEVINE
jgi:hypothetical protein